LFFGCCYAHHVHGCITLVVCIKQLFIVLAFFFVDICFDGLLVISFCCGDIVPTLCNSKKYIFQVSKFYFYFLL
jgi:hypothetical protein